MSLSLKSKLFLHAKNSFGWSSKRKIIVFAIDDYGNIRMASKQARQNLERAGVNVTSNRFDQYDGLETAEDLSQLYDTLSSVKDLSGRPAVFTAYALPCTIDFEQMAAEDYHTYRYLLLPEKLRQPGYEGTWELWQEGISKRLIIPQYHGREHLNLKLIMQLVKERDPHVMACFHERSLGGLVRSRHTTVSYVCAFQFDQFEENEDLIQIAAHGLRVFEQVFGFSATCFTAPGAPAHHTLEHALAAHGVTYIDTPYLKKEHQGSGIYRYRLNRFGSTNSVGQRHLIRNSVFEPLLNNSVDWVDRCLAEIRIAFALQKPAIISSHRVNFCGGIDPEVRAHGLRELKRLLAAIVKRWPDVEFMSAPELGDLMQAK